MSPRENANSKDRKEEIWDFESYDLTGMGSNERKKRADKLIKIKNSYGWHVYISNLENDLSSNLIFKRKKDYNGPKESTLNKWWVLGLVLIPQILVFFTLSQKTSPWLKIFSIIWLIFHSLSLFLLFENQ